ncbi:MAG TPA: hypothetical protein VFI34_10055 [Candidatus Limnocylindrales bacterium]|nr:hypothetical protein [Candidatus Limnocylindrales bacterium]
MPRLVRARPDNGRRTGSHRGRALGAAASLAGAGLVVATLVGGAVAQAASTPVAVGFRDLGFGGAAATRATSDPEQSKLWYTADGYWWGALFVSSGTGSGGSHFDIFRKAPGSSSWVDTTVRIDSRDHSHADYLYDPSVQKLYVVSSKGICDAPRDGLQPCNDAIRVWRYSYVAATHTWTLDAGSAKVLAGGGYIDHYTGGGSNAATIARDASGRIWVVYTRDDPSTAAPTAGTTFTSNVWVASTASDGDPATTADETNWALPQHLETLSATPGLGLSDQVGRDNTAAVVAFGTNVGIYYTDDHASGTESAKFVVHANADAVGTWSAPETVVSGGNAVEAMVNLKAGADGSVYAAVRTGVSARVKLIQRAPGGGWTPHTVWTTDDGNTRAQVVVDNELGVAYVFSTVAGVAYVKGAPLAALDFGPGVGTAFIKSASDPSVDDVTLTKQPVNHATGIVAEASDRTTFWFLHNEMALGATDVTPPSGTVSINAGAAFTVTRPVSLTVGATDAGSGVQVVRIANVSGHVNGAGQLDDASAVSFSFGSPIPWTLTAGDGTKTVFVQFRDAAGNWSAPVSDAIGFDTTGPVGSVSINGGAGVAGDASVSLNVTATDAGVGTVSAVRIANAATVDGSGLLSDASAVTSAYAATKPWSLSAGPDGLRTVYVQWKDALGNWSGVASDSITLADITPPSGHVLINAGAVGIHSLSVTLSFPNTSADATEVRILNCPTAAGTAYQPLHATIACGPLTGTLTNRSVKSVSVQFRDGAGNESAIASDTAIVDLTRPVLRGVVATRWSGTRLMNGTSMPIALSWPGATDTITGVGSYQVWVSRDGGKFTFVATVGGRSLGTYLGSGHSYRYRVYALDRAGNRSAGILSATVRAAAYQDTNASVVYRGAWRKTTSTVYSGGTVHWANAKAGTVTSASLRFSGRSVAWVAALGPTRGKARVYVDGRLITTVNLHATATTYRRSVFARSWTAVGTHTIRVVAYTGRLDVDAFLVLR